MTSRRQKAAAERWKARLADRIGGTAGDEAAKAAVWLDEARRLAKDLPEQERNARFEPARRALQVLARELTERGRR